MAVEDLSFRVRIDEIEKELSKIPGLTGRELKKAAKAAAAEWGGMSDAAKKAAKESAKEHAHQHTRTLTNSLPPLTHTHTQVLRK